MADETSHILWSTAAINALAVLVAPAIALWVQRRIDKGKGERDRKQAIFNTLWVNRRRHFYIARIDALNMIDVEFYSSKPVRSAWMDLFAHFRDPHPGNTDDQIIQQRDELYTTLLYEMSKVLRYDMGRSEIRDSFYRPEFHNTVESMDFETRTLILNLLKSDALPVRFVKDDPSSEAH